MVVIRCDHLNTFPIIDPVSTVVLQADTRNVETVFVAGKALKRDGALVGLDLGRARSLATSSLEYLLGHTRCSRTGCRAGRLPTSIPTERSPRPRPNENPDTASQTRRKSK